jgi:hypothetical protein
MSTNPADVLAKIEALGTRLEQAIVKVETGSKSFYTSHMFYVGLIVGSIAGVIIRSVF